MEEYVHLEEQMEAKLVEYRVDVDDSQSIALTFLRVTISGKWTPQMEVKAKDLAYYLMGALGYKYVQITLATLSGFKNGSTSYTFSFPT